MTVALRSLRVTAELDASSYARGAALKAAADKAMIASAGGVGASLAAEDAALQKLAPNVARLSRAYIDGYGPAAKFHREVMAVGNAMSTGLSADRALLMLRGITTNFGQVANSAALAKAGYVSLVPVIDQVNAELARQGTLQDMSVQRFTRQAGAVNQYAAAARLGTYQTQNLAYQLNDISVMLASGQAPFTMLMQQGMQIGQGFGNMGLGAAVRSLGAGMVSFLLNPINLAVVGFASLTAGAVYFFKQMKSGLPTVEDLLKRQTDILSELKGAYGDAAKDIGKVPGEGRNIIEFRARLNEAQTRESIKADLAKIMDSLSPNFITSDTYGDIAVALDPKSNPLIAFKDVVEKFNREMAAGVVDTAALRTELIRIAEANPALISTAEQLFNMTDALDAAKRKNDAFRAAISATFRSIERDSMTALKAWEDASAIDVTKLRRGFDLDLRAMTVKSPTERGDLAAERERLSMLGEEVTTTERLLRIENARRLATAEANKEISDASRQRLQEASQTVANAQFELSLIGKTSAQVTVLRNDWAAYLELRREAEEKGIAFDQAQYERLQKQHELLGKIINQQNVRRLEDDLAMERKLASMSSSEADIYRRLYSAGIKEGTEDWNQLAAQIRETNLEAQSFFTGVKQGFDTMVTHVNDFAASGRDILTNFFTGLEDQWVKFAQTGKFSFKDMLNTMLADVSRLAYRMTLSGILGMLGIGSTAQPGGGGLMGMLFGGGGTSAAPSQQGGLGLGGLLARLFGGGGAAAPSITPSPGGVTAPSVTQGGGLFSSIFGGIGNWFSQGAGLGGSLFRMGGGPAQIQSGVNSIGGMLPSAPGAGGMSWLLSALTGGMVPGLPRSASATGAPSAAPFSINDYMRDNFFNVGDTGPSLNFGYKLPGQPGDASSPGGISPAGIGGWITSMLGKVGGAKPSVPGLPGAANSNVPGLGLQPGLSAPGMASPYGSGPFLNLIGRAEGTDFRGGLPARGYNETLDYGRWTGGDRNLTGMNLNQIYELQQSMRTPENRALYGDGAGSSALGRYQITSRTLAGLREQMGLSGKEMFDPAMQDRMAMQLMQNRGPNVAGLRNEWRGLEGIPGSDILGAYKSQMNMFNPNTMGDQLGLGGANQFQAQMQSAQAAIAQQASSMAAAGAQFNSNLTSSLGSITNGAQTAGNGFGSALGGALRNVIGQVGGTTGSILAPLLSIFGLADGGQVSGRGTGRSDSILARLSHGEYVVNAESARRNRPWLDMMNFGRATPGHMAPAANRNVGGPQKTINITMQNTYNVPQTRELNRSRNQLAGLQEASMRRAARVR